MLDYFAPLELSFLTFYVAPVLFLVWFVGPAAGFLGAVVATAFWTWEDVLSAHAHPTITLHVTDWNLFVRAIFLALFVWVVAELKRALERERHAAQERLEHDVVIAQEVQTRLFPRKDPEIPGLDCHGVCRPARGVAGDYYDFLALEPGRTGIAVGDVAGKGLPAALLMASLQGSLRSFASMSRDGPASLAQGPQHPAPRPDGAEPVRHVLLGGLRRDGPRADLGQRGPQRADAPARARAPSRGSGRRRTAPRRAAGGVRTGRNRRLWPGGSPRRLHRRRHRGRGGARPGIRRRPPRARRARGRREVRRRRGGVRAHSRGRRANSRTARRSRTTSRSSPARGELPRGV